MKRKNAARNALFTSIISLLLCVSMLVGTTFAWFTDSVTSANNVIASGNLDVELYYADKADSTKWTEVTSATDVFGYSNWEPGYTKVVYFKVVNAGSLALRYKLSADVNSETEATNQAGEKFLLSDYLRTEIVAANATRDEILAKTGTKFNQNFLIGESQLLNPNDEAIVGLAIWMPTTVGNEANHNGTAPEINFGVNLIATQYTKESDSFGSDYDTNATYPVVSTPVVITPPAAGETSDNIVLTTTEEVTPVTIEVPGEIIDALPPAVTSIALAHTDPEVNTTEKTVTFHAIDIVDQNGKPVELSGLNLTDKLTIKLPLGDAFNEGDSVTVYHDGELICTAIVDKDHYITYEVAHLCEVVVEGAPDVEKNDEGVYAIGTAAELFAFARSVNTGKSYAGEKVVLTADIDLNNAAWTPIGTDLSNCFSGTFDGNGHTIYNLNVQGVNNIGLIGYAAYGGNVKNLTVKHATAKGNDYVGVIMGRGYTDIVNCHVENATVTSTPYMKDGVMDGGAKAGGVIGQILEGEGNTVTNCSVKNVTVYGFRDIGGVVGMVHNNNSCSGNTAENVTLGYVMCDEINADKNENAGAIYGRVQSSATVSPAKDSAENKAFELKYIASTAEELKTAMKAAEKGNVIHAEGVVVEGKSGLNINGATIIGATFKNVGDQAVSGTINGTFKECTFEGTETIRWCYTDANTEVLFEDCVIKTTLRGVHFDVMNGNVTFKNCEINGFNAYSGSGTMTFEGCTFGSDKSNYNGLNIYTNTNLINCTFNFVSGKTNFIDMEGTGKTLTITDCTATLDGAAANVADFVGGSKLDQNTVDYK